MPKQIWKNAQVKFKDSGGTTHDISGQVQSVTLNYSVQTPNVPAMGDNTNIILPSLKDWTAEVTLYQDFTSSAAVDTVLFDEVGASSAGEIEIVPDKDTAVGVNNPAYHGKTYLTNYPPVGGNVGDVLTVGATFSPAGDLTRNTSAQL